MKTFLMALVNAILALGLTAGQVDLVKDGPASPAGRLSHSGLLPELAGMTLRTCGAISG